MNNEITTILSTSSVDKQKLEGFVKEISNSMLRMDAERDLIKDICSRAKDELGIESKTLKTVSKIYHKNTIMEEKSTTEQIFDVYEFLFGSTANNNNNPSE